MRDTARKKQHAKWWLIPVFTAIYFLGLMAGIVVLSYARIKTDQSALELEVWGISSYLAYTDLPISAYSLTIGETTALLYDEEGSCCGYLFSPVNSDRTYDFRDVAGSYFAGDYGNITSVRHIYVRDVSSIYAVYARVTVDDASQESTGIVYLFYRLTDLPVILNFYVIIYTLIFSTITAVFVINECKNREITRIQHTYVSNISHDLKSPIASIKCLTEALSDGMVDNPDQQAIYYGTILRESNRLESSVMDMLELSRVQSMEKFNKTREQASGLLAPVLEKYTILYDELSIRFSVDPSVREIRYLVTNKEYCARILDILLNNAAKFVDIDGNVRLSAARQGKSWVFCVEDDGIGIPPEDQQKIFLRFYKGNTEYNKSGTGLGLAIAREMCTQMKERIWVESEQGNGARFYFTVKAG